MINWRKTWPLGAALFALVLGAVVGIGGYTFAYAEGFSYFKKDPAACVNCHIMQPEYDAWQKSSHHTVAVCVDCHLPEAFIPKYLVKSENGWRHGKLFTTGKFKEPIEVQAAGLRVLQENCERCHGGLAQDMHGGASVAAKSEDESVPCVKCHATVGHGVRAGIGGPLRDEEREPQIN